VRLLIRREILRYLSSRIMKNPFRHENVPLTGEAARKGGFFLLTVIIWPPRL
jgi:hypothetical protein